MKVNKYDFLESSPGKRDMFLNVTSKFQIPLIYVIFSNDVYICVLTSKLYIPSTLNIDLILWHTQLIVGRP